MFLPEYPLYCSASCLTCIGFSTSTKSVHKLTNIYTKFNIFINQIRTTLHQTLPNIHTKMSAGKYAAVKTPTAVTSVLGTVETFHEKWSDHSEGKQRLTHLMYYR